MSNKIILPPELKISIKDRSELWAEVDRTKEIANHIVTLAKKVPAGGNGPPIVQLVDIDDPPTELMAVLSTLRVEAEAIDRVSNDIQNTVSVIARLQQERQVMIIACVIGGILLLLFLLAQFTAL